MCTFGFNLFFLWETRKSITPHFLPSSLSFPQEHPVCHLVVCTCASALMRNVIKQNLWNHLLLIQVSFFVQRLLSLVLECSAETTCSAVCVLGSVRCLEWSETECLLEPESEHTDSRRMMMMKVVTVTKNVFCMHLCCSYPAPDPLNVP